MIISLLGTIYYIMVRPRVRSWKKAQLFRSWMFLIPNDFPTLIIHFIGQIFRSDNNGLRIDGIQCHTEIINSLVYSFNLRINCDDRDNHRSQFTLKRISSSHREQCRRQIITLHLTAINVNCIWFDTINFSVLGFLVKPNHYCYFVENHRGSNALGYVVGHMSP